MAKGSDVRALTPEDGAREAGVKILWTRFDDMWSYASTVSKDFDIDGVHDMRVASRRLRTAMQTFKPYFGKKAFKEHGARIKDIADLLGEVRDRDVLLAELKDDLERLPENERSGLQGLINGMKSERKMYRESLKLALDELERAAYDREFLSYLARNA